MTEADRAGEFADMLAGVSEAFLAWLDEYARHEVKGAFHDNLRDAFLAGAEWGVRNG